MIRLKPCPFCGENAETKEHKPEGHPHYEMIVGCRKCKIGMRNKDSKIAIGKWNTRNEVAK